jgi:hypothetical protein
LYRLSGLAIALITGFISFLLPTVDNITTLKLLRSWYDISPSMPQKLALTYTARQVAHTIKTVAIPTANVAFGTTSNKFLNDSILECQVDNARTAKRTALPSFQPAT